MSSVYGWVASSITLIYKLPQIYKLYKTKKSDDLSVYSLLIQSVSCVFYIIHGASVRDNPIIVMGTGALIETMVIVGMYYLYRKQTKLEIETDDQNIIK